MSEKTPINPAEVAGAVYRSDSRRILAALIRLLGDFDLAEEALHDAFAAALDQWPREGVPANPRAWLVSTGRFKAIDSLRRQSRFDSPPASSPDGPAEISIVPESETHPVRDDELRLIFTCCHPSLAPEARVALTLREVCDLTTEEIASAFLVKSTTIAQRIVRAKAKIRESRIPFQLPARGDLSARLAAVLQVIYLVFNEGYSASSGASLIRPDLSGEAIRLGRHVVELLPDPESIGLLALMLIQDSRRAARTTASGDLILLESQDRSLWNREQIDEGRALADRALRTRGFGTYAVQAAIAAVHASAVNPAETDWTRIVSLYDLMLRLEPSPVIELNRAVAVAMRDGPESGLELIDAILRRGELADYHLAHSARGELFRRLGRAGEARAAYERALRLTLQEPERRFIGRRLRELG